MKTSSKDARAKQGREIRNGVLCYDGTGPSGYRGACAQPKLSGSLLRDESPLLRKRREKLEKAAARRAEKKAAKKARSH